MRKPVDIKTRGVTSFEYAGKRVRVILDNQSRLWWVAKDVCEVLGLQNPSVAVRALDDDERSKKNLGRQGITWLINESGLYALIFRSTEPKAKPFRKWVTSEVLPAIYEISNYLGRKEQESSNHLTGSPGHRRDDPKPLPDSLPPAEPVDLPPCSSTSHVSPNICLQSALFGVVKKGQRKIVKDVLIASYSGSTVRFTGQQLDQGDLDVFSQAIHLSAKQKNQRNDGLVQFTVRSFLKSIGRKSGKSGQEWLLDSIYRLKTSLVKIEFRSPGSTFAAPNKYWGSLIDEIYYESKTQTYYLRINSKLAALFDSGWTPLDWQQRLRLRTDLARWLHGFYASQQAPYPCKVSTLRKLCGSQEHRISNFRFKLRKALDQLVESGAIRSWKIDGEDKVYVQPHRVLPANDRADQCNGKKIAG